MHVKKHNKTAVNVTPVQCITELGKRYIMCGRHPFVEQSAQRARLQVDHFWQQSIVEHLQVRM